MSEPMSCVCPGSPYGGGGSAYPVDCGEPATQEDFLCDRCRTIRCADIVTAEDQDRAAQMLMAEADVTR